MRPKAVSLPRSEQGEWPCNTKTIYPDEEAKAILVVGASGSDSSVNTYFQMEMV
jgi:hypothetical protein